MNVGSLFSGIGGIELGFERAGFRTEWFVENDEYCKEILRKRFPNTKVYDDVTKVDFKNVPKVNVLTGGFPCQDISTVGKRAGIKGSRSSLWSHYARAIGEVRPRFVFIENVSALLGRGLHTVLCDLCEVGYDAEWHCVPASSVGAPHRRDRVFILAYPESIEPSSIRREPIPFNAERNAWLESECNGASQGHTWSIEPDVGRVADGVPNRVDRIKCLGNAVVPQVAQVFAEAIKEEIMKKNEVMKNER